MKTVEELDIPKLTTEQTEQLCSTAEETARKHVLHKIPSKKIEKLNICAEVRGTKPVKLTVDIEIVLSPAAKGIREQEIIDQAVQEAFKHAENYLRKLKCHSPT